MPDTNSPNAAGRNPQISTSMPAPENPGVRTRPGFGGTVLASANNR